MDELIQNLGKYLNETLGLTVKPRAWSGTADLPYFLREPYSFYLAEILNLQYLLMVASSQSDQTPAIIENHIRQVQKSWNGDVIYVTRQIKSYERRRLIDRRVSFIVPGNQMYLPILGMDLREYFKKAKPRSTRISPSTQAIIIYALVTGPEHRFVTKELTELLQYTPMTISRAFDEIELHELASCTYEGRERLLRFNLTKKDLWEKAQKYMRTPVKKRTMVDYSAKDYLRVQAGLTALAHYSMLAAPARPVFAVGSGYWNQIRHNPDIRELSFGEKRTYDVEIWHYDPALITGIGVVDPFSLFLSLRDLKDARIESSLDKMMDNVSW